MAAFARFAPACKIVTTELGDDFGGADCMPGETFFGAFTPGLERQDLVEGSRFPDAAELERALHGEAFLADAEGDERIVHVNPTEIELVGAGAGVGIEKRRERRTGNREKRI